MCQKRASNVAECFSRDKVNLPTKINRRHPEPICDDMLSSENQTKAEATFCVNVLAVLFSSIVVSSSFTNRIASIKLMSCRNSSIAI